MLEQKKISSLAAICGAAALMMAPAFAPAFAQDAAKPADAAAAAPAAAAAEAPKADAPAPEAAPEQVGGKSHGKLTVIQMFSDADWIVKIVMGSLIICSVVAWTLLIIKLMEFGSLNKTSNAFIEAFRGARNTADIYRIATSEEFEGNPMADMAAVAAEEVETSKKAGLQVTGEHRSSTIDRAAASINAVQAGLGKNLSGGMTFLATIGSSGPFVGLFGTVYGIMNSFIGIANTNTTNLAVVAPGIAEALLATGIGLFAAIPAVIFYNFFNVQIAGYGARTEQFVAELMNTISRHLDKGA